MSGGEGIALHLSTPRQSFHVTGVAESPVKNKPRPSRFPAAPLPELLWKGKAVILPTTCTGYKMKLVNLKGTDRGRTNNMLKRSGGLSFFNSRFLTLSVMAPWRVSRSAGALAG
jgi:hypothetical protein